MRLDTTPVAARAVAVARGHVRVAVFGRRPIEAAGFAALLARHAEVDVAVVGTSARAAARAMAAIPVDVVVIGIASEHIASAARLLAKIPAERLAAGPRVVGIVSGEQDLADMLGGPSITAITTRAGSDILREVVTGTLPSRISTISPHVVSPAPEIPVPDSRPRSRLTPREQDVLRGIENGLSTNEIALRLGIAPNTVRTHAQRLMSKLAVHSRVQVAAIAAGSSHAPALGR